MTSDNQTPFNANKYDSNILSIVPFYDEFHKQTLNLVKQLNLHSLSWLDLGCGSGELCLKAAEVFPDICFTMVDPSEQMLELAKEKNSHLNAYYICSTSQEINFNSEFDVATAIMSHHYMDKISRFRAVSNTFHALKDDGIFIYFENTVPESEELKDFELARWGSFQLNSGRTHEQVSEHLKRCGISYFPLTISEHISLLRSTGFRFYNIFWHSYMQTGFYAIK